MFPRNKNFVKGEALGSHKFNSEVVRTDHNPSSSIVLNLFTKWLIQFQSISSKQITIIDIIIFLLNLSWPQREYMGHKKIK